MNVARVLSVSPTFHKLLVESTEHSWSSTSFPTRSPQQHPS